METSLLSKNLRSLRSLVRGFTRTFEPAQPTVLGWPWSHEAQKLRASVEAAYDRTATKRRSPSAPKPLPLRPLLVEFPSREWPPEGVQAEGTIAQAHAPAV